MAEKDIRFSREAATLTHQSGRGKVVRNAGNFTRGSQLFTHQIAMWWKGARIPFILWLCVTAILACVLGFATYQQHEIHLVLMKVFAETWSLVELDPTKTVNLTLPTGQIVHGEIQFVPDHPAVIAAWERTVGLLLGSFLGGAFLSVPVAIWFVDYSNRKGKTILQEKHERGSILIEASDLAKTIKASNETKMREECLSLEPQVDPAKVAKLPLGKRIRAGFHQPYTIAGIPFPWRSEQQHVMLLGTTGTGKTTELKRLVLQARARGHDCVIFDPVGSFVESFYDPARDTILNPRDKRCPAWSIFNDAHDYVDMLNAAQALIPDPAGKTSDDFWQKAARTIFVEMCMKLREEGLCTNGALAHHLMEVPLSEIHEKLQETIAAPLVSPDAARMAQSCRATLTTHANAIRHLPDPTADRPAFSLRDWITREGERGSILFLTSSYSDMILSKPLLTMWLNIAMQALFTMGRTRDLRTWFLIDEVHALHRVPAIEQGLQTARQVGGAIVLGMHSFEKLKETYGENAAYFIDGLAGTKLFLRSADAASAKHASDSIGEREIRQMDEAYSYGANTIRDGTTITPTKKMEPLIIPSDMRDLPDLHGVVKLAAGFPAARIKLVWRDYTKRAEPYERIEEMRAGSWNEADQQEEESEGGSEAISDSGETFDPATGEVLTGGEGSDDGGDPLASTVEQPELKLEAGKKAEQAKESGVEHANTQTDELTPNLAANTPEREPLDGNEPTLFDKAPASPSEKQDGLAGEERGAERGADKTQRETLSERLAKASSKSSEKAGRSKDEQEAERQLKSVSHDDRIGLGPNEQRDIDDGMELG